MKHTMLPLSEFIARRAAFAEQMADNSIALFPANGEVTRSNDTEYNFCQDKDFYYLTGFNEPDAILAIEKVAGEARSVLFCRDKDPLQEVWHGRRVGAEKAKTEYGFDQTFVLADADEQMVLMIQNKSIAYFAQGAKPEFDARIATWFDTIRATPKSGNKAPAQFNDWRPFVHEMRLIKSAAELDVMRKASVISGNAHQRAMACTRPQAYEYQVAAEIHHEFAFNNALNPAYGSIVGGGVNATILHYTDNCDALNDGEMLLIDAGCELAGYAADITRTFPINGKFSADQKALYDVVLASQNAAIDAIKPGATLAELNDIVNEVLTRGLVELGILNGDIETLLEEKAVKKYFIHGLGHWLGLDVHDVGDYHIDENRLQQRPFEPGMVMTIEPGIYINEGDECDARWHGIGIRIEDNILVTENGFENLTVNAVKTTDDIEALMSQEQA